MIHTVEIDVPGNGLVEFEIDADIHESWGTVAMHDRPAAEYSATINRTTFGLKVLHRDDLCDIIGRGDVDQVEEYLAKIAAEEPA